LQPAEEQVETRQEQDGTLAILDTGWCDLHAEDHPEGVDEEVSLAPADLLARIVADGVATLLGAFDALAVEEMAAVGEGLRPSATRTFTRKLSLSFSHRPLLRQAEK
jgi:hypothetical protein